MKYRSVFDIIGPVMIGPKFTYSRRGKNGAVARQLFRHEPEK